MPCRWTPAVTDRALLSTRRGAAVPVRGGRVCIHPDIEIPATSREPHRPGSSPEA